MNSLCCTSEITEGFCSNCGHPCEVDPFHTVKIKPMSVNGLYIHKALKKKDGKLFVTRIKTSDYRKWQNDVHYLLPSGLKFEGKLCLELVIAYSSANSDLDNGVKAIQDSLQTKYGFNDNKIYELRCRKLLVKKGDEYFRFHLYPIEI